MHPLSDKDLDRLSREAAEQYDVEQNTSGWDKLEQKLNKHLPEKDRKERRRFLFFIWLFALLSGGGLLWILSGINSPRFITLKESSSKMTHESTSPNRTVDQSKPGTKNSTDNDTKANDRSPSTSNGGAQQNDGNITDAEKNVEIKTSETDTRKSNLNNRPTSTDRGVSATKAPITQRNKKSKRSENLAAIAPSPMLPLVALSENKENKNAIAPGENRSEKDISSPAENESLPDKNQPILTDSANQPKAEVLKTVADSTSTVKKAATPPTKSRFNKGLEVALLAAPDMSNVKFTHSDKVGFNVGLQIGYRFSQRWSVNSGVIYTKKNYTSQGEDFNPEKGSWLDNVKLELVEGNCFMFDIPLNVRYDLNANSKTRYFLSTGLSTYLMKKEEYHYHYQYANGSPGYRYRSSSSDEQHWLSILNISAGFEKKLSNRLSIQAEPYLKIPLAGIGYGNLQLNSYGIYFLVKFSTKR